MTRTTIWMAALALAALVGVKQAKTTAQDIGAGVGKAVGTANDTVNQATDTVQKGTNTLPPAPVQTQTQRQQFSGQTQARASVRGRVNGETEHQEANLQTGVRFGQFTNQGLTINAVEPTSVFFRSGIRQNDVVVSVDGRPIRSDVEFYRWVRPGVRTPVVVLRAGRSETIFLDAPQQFAAVPQAQVATSGHASVGIEFDAQANGAAIVQAIVPGSPGEQAGLQPGDAIIAINNQSVQSQQDALAIIDSMRPGDRLNITFERRQQSQTELVLSAQAGAAVQTETRSVLVPQDPAVSQPREYEASRPVTSVNPQVEVETYPNGTYRRPYYYEERGRANRAERRAMRRR